MSIVESPLGSAHLNDLLRLEYEFPPSFRHGRERLAEKLAALDEIEFSMSWILHENGECLGYIVVFPQTIKVSAKEKERIIFVDDIFVLPGCETMIFRLIKLFSSQAKELGMGNFAIEAYARAGAYKTFTRHDSLFRRLGWVTSGKYEYWDQSLQEEMCWIRWDPYQEKGKSTSRTSFGDLVSMSGEESDDFAEPLQRLVSLDDSHHYAHNPFGRSPQVEEEPDDLQALTEVMLGAGDQDLIEIPAESEVDRASLQDVFGILEFFGSQMPAKREAILRRPRFGS